MYILLVPIVVVVLAILSVVFVIARKWMWSIVLGVACLVLNAWSETFALNFPFSRHSIRGIQSDIRIMEYNVFGQSEYFLSNEDHFVGILSLIDEVNPDVLLLAEYNHVFNKEFGDSLYLRFPYTTKSAFPKYDGNDFIFSRFPIEDVRQYIVSEKDSLIEKLVDPISDVKPPKVLKTGIYDVVVSIGDYPIQLFFCHLQSNNYSIARKNMSDSLSWIDGLEEYVDRLRFGYSARAIQAVILRDSIEQKMLAYPNRPIIVAGDFNDLSGSYVMRTIQGDNLEDAWWQGGFGLGFTFDAYHLLLRLDHILYSPKSLELSQISVLHPYFSDHYPLVADFSFIEKYDGKN